MTLHSSHGQRYAATHVRGNNVAPHSPPSGHVRPLSAPHADGQTRTSPHRGVQLSGGRVWRWGEACSALPLLRIPKLTRQCKRATRKPPPVCLRYDQNLRSKLSAKLERLLVPTRSMTRRMSAELSPSSEVLLSPISAPAPQSWVVAAALVRWQMKRGANDTCVLLSATVSASNGLGDRFYS